VTESTDFTREDKDGVAIVTFTRPEKLNALSKSMRMAISDAVEDVRDRADLRVLLIRSTGRYFTAGVNIQDTTMANPERNAAKTMVEYRRDYRRPTHMVHDELEELEKPVVIAIQGPCLGLGVELAGSCDFRLATPNARFGLPEINVGVIAGSGGTSRFTRLCGIGWSKWLSMAGEQIDAQTAMMAGFVQAIYPVETFEEEVWAFCQRLQTRPAEVQGAVKTAIELCYDLDRNSGRRIERLTNTSLAMRDNSALVDKVMSKGKKPAQIK
jgi:enoyl-CoA hydratase